MDNWKEPLNYQAPIIIANVSAPDSKPRTKAEVEKDLRAAKEQLKRALHGKIQEMNKYYHYIQLEIKEAR